jgi:serine/threonine-protein kinase
MDYIDGQPLTKLILNKALTDRQIGVLLSKVARALHHAHERGILHRDIKPDNILVDKNRQPFVVDFGIARDQEEEGEALTRVGQVVGTPYYIAPEQIRSLGLGPHTDVWALGVVLYVTLSGKPPFRGKSELETLEKVLRVEPERPVREGKPVPNDLWAICSRCLQKDPAKRYRDAQQLALDLERYVRDEPTSVAPPGLGAQVQRWIRHRAWPVHAAAFGVASAAVFVTLFALFAQGLAAFVPASQVGEVRAWMGRSLGVGWLVMALAGTGIAKVLSKKPSAQPDGDGDCL